MFKIILEIAHGFLIANYRSEPGVRTIQRIDTLEQLDAIADGFRSMGRPFFFFKSSSLDFPEEHTDRPEVLALIAAICAR